MYYNIGGKIKGLAIASFAVTAIAGFISGIVIIAEVELVGVGLLTMFGGPIFGWLSSWVLYGFGELIDMSKRIAENTAKEGKVIQPVVACPTEVEVEHDPKFDCERIVRMGDFKTDGCICCGGGVQELERCELTTEIGTRKFFLCKTCIAKYEKASRG